MQQLWREDLPAVVAVVDDGFVPRLVAQVAVTGIGNAVVHADIRLDGELCAVGTPALAAEVERLLELGVTDLRFDLAALRMCTSAGIDLWVDLASRMLCAGGDVRLAGASGVVRRALDAVGVSDSARVEPRHRS